MQTQPGPQPLVSRAGVGVRRILQDGGLDSALAVLIFSATAFSADGVGARGDLRGAVLVEKVMLVGEHPRNPAIDGPERVVLDVAVEWSERSMFKR